MSQHVPCPKCGFAQPVAVSFTWWGGVLGPKLFSHVKCPQCGCTYNGKTGRPNTGNIVAYSVIAFVIGIVLIVLLFSAMD